LAKFFKRKSEDAVHPDNKKIQNRVKTRNFFTKELRMFVSFCAHFPEIKKIQFQENVDL